MNPERRWGVVTLCWALIAVGAAPVSRAVASHHRHGQIFPVRGPHGTRGPVGEFGAPRSGGRTHEGFDVTAACGTKLVSARAGAVLKRSYDPVLDGNFVVIHARGMGHNYLYAHLRRPAIVRVG